MLPKSFNIAMQCFVELCISSQFTSAEIDDDGIHKIMPVVSELCVHEKMASTVCQTFLWIIMMRLSKGNRKEYKYLSCVYGVDRRICHEGH